MTSDGKYLLLDNNQVVLDKAVIMSERLFANYETCLRFYYYLNHSLPMAMYSKLKIYKSEDHKNLVKIREIYGLTNDWILAETPIKTDDLNNKYVWIYLVCIY